MNTVLDLYMDIFNDVVVFSVAKVTKCFEKILFEVIILFLVFQKGNYHPNKSGFARMLSEPIVMHSA
jgi:hypothetical protein